MTALLLAFNLAVNAAFSFAIGAAFALVGARFVRRERGLAQAVLFTIPFAKVVLDVVRGVPSSSFLWHRARGDAPDLGSFQIGLGMEWFIPKVVLGLGAMKGDARYTQSAADVIGGALVARAGWLSVAAVVGVAAAGALVRLGLRVRASVAVAARAALLRRGPRVAERNVGRRRVSIHLTEEALGSPFAAGIFEPFIVFPRVVWDALGPAEREGAIEHELGHVAQHHLVWKVAVGVIRDVFWFIPGTAAIERGLARSFESAADARAVARGVDPVVLASALVRAREAALTTDGARAPGLAAARGQLTERVRDLLQPPARGHHAAARATFVAWVAAAALLATFFGNN